MTCSSNSEVFSVAVFSSETGQWRNSKLRFPEKLCFWHETSIGNNGIIYCTVGDTMLKGIVAFNPFKDDSREEEEEQQQQRCRLISLPLEFTGC
ncbi:hypothetical protein TIFTF001_041611 [Ficus carica]|uniref:F-box protein At3g26010-like beta-propeller domain-containing protein n=1 Tax=Ficus carica TaxID=3494 RepID=A0AA88CV83_FICCA|nr:hypothetical protein TIFTF001_041611 [Ficus carica]